MRPEPSRPGTTIDLLAAAGLALLFALAFYVVGIPGGLIFGGTLGAALWSVGRKCELKLPNSATTTIQVLIGVLVGTRVTPDVASSLGSYLGPALVTTTLLLVAGVGIARLLHRFVGVPPWIVLATCPGALEALLSIAIERDDGPVEVGLFHLVRVILVIASLPLLLIIF